MLRTNKCFSFENETKKKERKKEEKEEIKIEVLTFKDGSSGRFRHLLNYY